MEKLFILLIDFAILIILPILILCIIDFLVCIIYHKKSLIIRLLRDCL
jgi:hypothetical protein